MIPVRPTSRAREAGIVLVTSLLLLLVITLLALSMFRSFGMQEKIAGNLREKHRALQAAQSAQQYAEWWMQNSNNINSVLICTATLLNANSGAGQICTNSLATQGVADVTAVPWTVGGAEIGVRYAPPGMTVSTGGATNTYASAPRFYITLVGPAASGKGNIYRVNAWGYGGDPNTVAVVESTYLVEPLIVDLGAT